METIIAGIIGALIGMRWGYVAVKKKFAFCRPRTYFNFISGKDIWRDIEGWAREYGYKLQTQSETERTYRSRRVFSIWLGCSAISYLLIRQDGDKIYSEAWVDIGLFSKLEVAIDDALLLLIRELGIHSVIPVNKLLEMLEIPVKIRESCRSRVFLESYTSNKEIWDVIEHWAKEEGYKLKSQSVKERLYKRSDFTNFPSNTLIRHDGDKVYVEAWVEVRTLFFKREIAANEADILSENRCKCNAMRVNSLLAMIGSPAMTESA